MNLAFIKERREKMGLRQIDLAQQADISLASLQNIEAGRANPSLSLLESLLHILGMKLEAQPTFIESESLLAVGLPLFNNGKEFVRVQNKNQLTKKLQLINPFQVQCDKERKALLAYLYAIKNHYPSFWMSLPATYNKWFIINLKGNQPSIKLKRLSLSFLKDIL